MYYKTIIKGKFDFGKAKTFEKIHKMAMHKVENLYREAVCLDMEEAFDDEEFTFTIPRTVFNITEKFWKNTVNLIEYLSQFAVVGRFHIWVIQDGQLILKKELEPNSEKNIVQYYIKGNRWMDEGNTDKAIESYNKAIAKYANHSTAYEKRGTINYQLKNYEDAIYDFKKSIKLYPQNGTAYFGLALALVKTGALEEAEKALEQTAKKTIPHQRIYWKARRMRGNILFDLKQYDKAYKEFYLISKRKFEKDDPNYPNVKYNYFMIGQCLFEMQRLGEAVNVLDKALEFNEGQNKKIGDGEILLLKGKILRELGDKKYLKVWKSAEELGNKKATTLLKAL